MSQPKNIAILIMAAGASSRMGEPKQLLKWGENTLIEHTIKTVLQLKQEKVILVLGANYHDIFSVVNHYPVTVLNNKDWKSGLGSSIARGVQHILKTSKKTDAVFIVLADQPFIDVSYLSEMITIFQSNQNTIIATAYKNNTFGVPVIFGKSYFSELSLLDTDKGAKQILIRDKDEIKQIDYQLNKADLDTKSEYKDLYNQTFND
ncbi:nucleotidyltransferase family protein [Formosa sp. PL04]|uniref:nucleotidyltransferase family protein n=1 Tax=Formosa sp. PL04 TaxID=3081755 RepID=UPI002981FD7C|nr:nucleotidyltransferase family protein [Formosa sp. PL04]MDW5288075.1 nucleotidyltransferase family protein [Formosa sp. PL04]